MGTLLKGEFNFQNLDSIRKAYSLAFYTNSTKVDVALSDKHIDALGQVRHLLIHRAGIVDQEYLDKIKGLPAPSCQAGLAIDIDGTLCYNLLSNVLSQCIDLLCSVDSWILARAKEKYDPEYTI